MNEFLNRRRFLTQSGLGLGSLALSSMLAREGTASLGPSITGQSHYPAKAKSVIWLFMAGGVSQV